MALSALSHEDTSNFFSTLNEVVASLEVPAPESPLASLTSHAIALFTYSSSLRQKGHYWILPAGRQVPLSFTASAANLGPGLTSGFVSTSTCLSWTSDNMARKNSCLKPPVPFCLAQFCLLLPSPSSFLRRHLSPVELMAPSRKHSRRTAEPDAQANFRHCLLGPWSDSNQNVCAFGTRFCGEQRFVHALLFNAHKLA